MGSTPTMRVSSLERTAASTALLSHGAGVLYQLVGNNCETLLYTFDLFTANGFGQPTGNVIRDAAGNFYGTTFIGQADVGYGYGVVYKVDASGHATVLHNFTGGADGGDPYGGVILDAKGTLRPRSLVFSAFKIEVSHNPVFGEGRVGLQDQGERRRYHQ